MTERPAASYDGYLRTAVLLAAFSCLALLVTWPALRFVTWWGAHDWLQFHAYYGAPRKALVEFGEIPGWNPYYYGGNVIWGHPHDPTLSPLFIPIVLFGEIVGSKIDMVVVLISGMCSMWLLSRRLRLSISAAFLASVVWGLNGWHAFHYAVGHCNQFPVQFMPLAVYCFLRALEDLRWSAASGAVLAFMYLSGGPYGLIFSVFVLGILGLLFSGARNNAKPFYAALASVAFAAGFAAVKLFPTMVFMTCREKLRVDQSGTGLFVLLRGLFDSSLPMVDETKYAGTPYGSWEYAAFIGYIPAIAFAAGAVLSWRRSWPWVAMALVFLVASFGNGSPVNFFSLFAAVPGLSGLHVPFRFIISFIFCVAVVAGMGLDAFVALLAAKGAKRVSVILAAALALAAATHLVWMHYDRPVALYRLASYFLPPKKYGGERPDVMPYRQLLEHEKIYVPRTYDQTLQVYANLLASTRLSWGYDNIRLPLAARFPSDPDYRGEAFLARENSGQARLLASTMNVYRVSYDALSGDTLVLNQNYMPGWTVRPASCAVVDKGGLVAAEVPQGRGEVTFIYRPKFRTLGGLVSALTILIAVALSKRRSDNRFQVGGPAGQRPGGATGPAGGPQSPCRAGNLSCPAPEFPTQQRR